MNEQGDSGIPTVRSNREIAESIAHVIRNGREQDEEWGVQKITDLMDQRDQAITNTAAALAMLEMLQPLQQSERMTAAECVKSMEEPERFDEFTGPLPSR